jgi:hypothetical protein
MDMSIDENEEEEEEEEEPCLIKVHFQGNVKEFSRDINEKMKIFIKDVSDSFEIKEVPFSCVRLRDYDDHKR